MADPRNTHPDSGPVMYRLQADNRTVIPVGANNSSAELRGGATTVRQPSAAPLQLDRSNRETDPEITRFDYAGGSNRYTSVARGPASGGRVNVITRNAQNQITGNEYVPLASLDPSMLLQESTADAAAAAAQRYGQHGNDHLRVSAHDVEYTRRSTIGRAEHGYRPIAPRTSSDQGYSQGPGLHAYTESQYAHREYDSHMPARGYQQEGRGGNFDNANTPPVLGPNNYSTSDQSSYTTADYHQRDVGSRRTSPAPVQRSSGSTSRPTIDSTERGAMHAYGTFDHRGSLHQDSRGGYNIERRSSPYHRPVSVFYTRYETRSYRNQQADDSLARSPPSIGSGPSSLRTGPSRSTSTRRNSSSNTTFGPASTTDDNPVSNDTFDATVTLHGKPVIRLNASGRPLYTGPGIDPLAFIRPSFAVSQTDESADRPAWDATVDSVNVNGNPTNYMLLDQPGGPQRPKTKIGDPDHIIGWNGSKDIQLQPNLLSMPDSTLGPKPGVEWMNAHDYKLHSHTAFTH